MPGFLKKYLEIIQLSLKFPFYYENWWIVFFDYLKILKLLRVREVLYRLRSGERYISRPSQFDIGILNEVYIYKVYNYPDFDISIRKNDIILDAGGYIGDFSVYAGKRAKNGMVYVFEPSTYNFEILRKNIKENRLRNVFIYNKGLYKETGKMVFYLDVKALGSSSLYSNRSKINTHLKKINIEVIGINQFLKNKKIKRLHFIKLDCEGAEFDIIYSLRKEILKNVRCLIVEYHKLEMGKNKNHSKAELINYLTKNGFKVYTDNDLTDAKLGYLLCRNMSID